MLSLLDFYKKKKKISQFFFCLLCLEYFLYPLLAAQHHVDGRQLFIYSFFLLKLILFLFSTNSNMKISRKTRPEDGRNPTLLECFQLVLYRFWFFSVGTAFYKEKFFEWFAWLFYFDLFFLHSHPFFYFFTLNSFYLKLQFGCQHPTWNLTWSMNHASTLL